MILKLKLIFPYRRQLEEAEEIAALNLAKYRKVQQELEEAEVRANLIEQVLAKVKVRGSMWYFVEKLKHKESKRPVFY